jgi:hypothetical protein
MALLVFKTEFGVILLTGIVNKNAIITIAFSARSETLAKGQFLVMRSSKLVCCDTALS